MFELSGTWVIMLIIIGINIYVLYQVFKVGTQHDHHHEIHDPKDSHAVQRLNEKYQLRIKEANEKALPQTLVTAPDAVDQTLSEAFTPEQPKKAPVRRRSGANVEKS